MSSTCPCLHQKCNGHLRGLLCVNDGDHGQIGALVRWCPSCCVSRYPQSKSSLLVGSSTVLAEQVPHLLARVTKPQVTMHVSQTSKLHAAATQPHASPVHHPAVRCHAAATSSAARSTISGLTKEQVEQFHQDGFLALPGFASKEQVAALMQRCHEMVEAWDPQLEARRLSVFTTKEEQSHAKVCSYVAHAACRSSVSTQLKQAAVSSCMCRSALY